MKSSPRFPVGVVAVCCVGECADRAFLKIPFSSVFQNLFPFNGWGYIKTILKYPHPLNGKRF
jgi:hypothetical protein